jgi:RHS repeat-associated protein
MGVTKYIWDGDDLLAEADATNAINVLYTHAPGPAGGLISTRIGTTSSYHHFDGLGSTRQLTNSAGTVTDTWIFDAWGNQKLRTGTTNVNLQWLGAFGYYFDTELQSHYVLARTYVAAVGLWTSVDPLIALTRMAYIYASNSPLLRVDPSGLQDFLGAEDFGTVGQSCSTDILENLDATLAQVRTTFFSNSYATQLRYCNDPRSWTRWDIQPLKAHDTDGFFTNACPEPGWDFCCNDCITVDGKKHWRHEVNYVLWGALMRLCGFSIGAALDVAVLYKAHFLLFEDKDGQPPKCHPASGQITPSLLAWIAAGYKAVGIGIWNPVNLTGLNFMPFNLYDWTDPDPRSLKGLVPTGANAIINGCTPCNKRFPENGAFGFTLFKGLGYASGIGGKFKGLEW